MSLIINGMSLPENEGMKELVIGRAPNGTEPIAIVSGDITEFYKIIEIPTPHGRLIDADILENKVAEWRDYLKFRDAQILCTVIDMIHKTPTVIEAEGVNE